jgi:hypothetical protein
MLLHIFSQLLLVSYKTIIINLEPCALNVDFQHFISKFNKKINFMDTLERRVWGERMPKDMVILQIILVFTLELSRPETFT